MLPTFSYEEALWEKGFTVIGIDEVGRGAFAGPVGVAGVVFEPAMNKKDRQYLLSVGIDDSKKLTPKKRLSLSQIIKDYCVSYATELVDVDQINKTGIANATFLGMKKVAQKISLKIKKPFLLIDAFEIPGMRDQKGIIHGDSLSLSIAAASIIAKVERDELMSSLSRQFPEYKWDENKGYGTKAHRSALRNFGKTDLHRLAFCQRTLGDL